MKNSLKSQSIGEAKITYRTTGLPFAGVSSSLDVVKFLRQIWDEDTLEYHESFCVISLNQKHKVIAYRFIGHGGLSAVLVDMKMVVQMALLSNASSIIVAHNHPSGGLIPSRQDIDLTDKLKKLTTLLEMPLLDHVILTATSYYSFADEGRL